MEPASPSLPAEPREVEGEAAHQEDGEHLSEQRRAKGASRAMPHSSLHRWRACTPTRGFTAHLWPLVLKAVRGLPIMGIRLSRLPNEEVLDRDSPRRLIGDNRRA